MDHHVGELRLKVRTDAEAPERVRASAEAFVRAAVERCADLLEARWPGRVVLVERWPLHLALEDGQLEQPRDIEAAAHAAADAIEAAADLLPVDASEASGPALFADEALWRASHLLARARGRLAWFHAALEQEPGDPLTALGAPPRRPMAFAVLRHLALAGALAEVLAVQSPGAVALLAAAWGCDEWPPDAPGDPAAGADAAAIAAEARSWPALPDTSRLLAMHVHAAARLGAAGLREARVAALARAAHEAAAATANERPGAPPRAAQPPLADAGSSAINAVESPPDESLRTELAGLFMLAPLLLELGLAEALWQACLPEATFIAEAWRTQVDPRHAHDPVFGHIGGTAVPSRPDASTAQLAEVAVAAVAALCAALPRRGLAELPAVAVSLADTPNGRLLLAAAEEAPFAFFAWPAATPAAVEEGLRNFLGAWSSNAVISASPALARLDTQGRLRARTDSPRTLPALPEAASAAAAALLAVVAGAPATLMAARLGAWHAGDRARFAAAWFERSARLLTAPDELRITLHEDARDLSLRRAGLDRDPGWVPWLKRKLVFVFEPRLGGTADDPP